MCKLGLYVHTSVKYHKGSSVFFSPHSIKMLPAHRTSAVDSNKMALNACQCSPPWKKKKKSKLKTALKPN